ncbi:nicotinate-nucleotide adenylyltransferase [Piscinibacter terrae]|uniref:nicotinate-nucleotide adenylyltransferase n=1 Tax=Piscinibacter terrae TaxID=2496871 RepID=UPI001F41E482|nr:nicotinate-nucleotide adenylyltransferase [Albitalea terrae]
MKRIGLLGGSFDPPHNAHLALARTALEHLRLDELWWLPQGHAYQKTRALSSKADRRAMLELAIAGEPRFRLEDCELERDGPTYSIDTVRELSAREPADWFFIIGQDQYANLHTWRDWPELLQRVTLAVAAREGTPVVATPEIAAVPHRVALLPLPRMDVSSTAIRTAATEGRDYTDMVPGPVARYIDQHHLYRGIPRS